jgi:group I intron endonuclease
MVGAGIYAIVNLKRQRTYVGRSANIGSRKNSHFSSLRKGCHCNAELQRDWTEDGEPFFFFVPLETTKPDKASMVEAERRWIREAQETHWVAPYNGTGPTGSGPKPGTRINAEQRKRLSEALRGKPKSESHKARISAAKAGKPCPAQSAALMGHKQSEETKARRAESLRKYHAEHETRPETGALISAALKGRVRSAEHSANISRAKTGKKQSPETVAARMEGMRLARLRRKAEPTGCSVV